KNVSRYFFFQAEDGIRDRNVTGVQTCALPIFLSALAPFLGAEALNWISDAGSPAIVIAYFLVSVGFLVLRRREPDMERPLRIGGTGKSGVVIGAISSVLTLLLFILYLPITPFSAELDWKSWVMFGAWLLVGVYFM